MSRANTIRFYLCSSLLLIAVHHALAQDGSKPAPVSTAPSDADAMRGPRVADKQGPPTLVHRDASGKLERLEIRPEQAAIDLLKLTPDDRKPAEAILATRLVEVNKALQEHYDAFLKIQTARQGGAKPEEVRPLMREFRPAVASLVDPPLVDRVASAIPEARRAEYRGYVDEYKRAFVASEPMNERGNGAGAGGGGGEGRGRGVARRENPDPAGDQMKPAGAAPATAADSAPIPPRVEVNLLLREMARALKGIVDDRKEHMDHFLKSIDATPEQEAQIRAIARESADANKKAGGNGGIAEPSQDEKLAVWRRILDVLTPEQRRKAMQLRGR